MTEKDNSTRSATTDKDKKDKKPAQQATVGETLSFVFSAGGSTSLVFFVGFVAAIGNGMVFPALAYIFSNSFSKLTGAATEGLGEVRELANTFMIVGSYALVMASIQTTCFEHVAYKASHNLRMQWFRALVRQDPAFFDVHDIGGIASSVGADANRYRRGLGRKFGEGMQFGTTGIGGVAYAFYVSWKVALVVFCVIPFVSVSALMVVKFNQTKTTRAAEAYSKAGTIAYSTVSGIKTVLSLNAVQTMLDKYYEATQDALQIATSMLVRQGFANGSMLGSFLCLYAVLCLYGTSLLAGDIEDSGCDPSNSVPGNETCENSGPDVFGAMLGVAFAGQGIGQVGNFLETFSAAKVSTFNALKAINRKAGAEEVIIYHEMEDNKSDNMSQSTRSNTSHGDLETPEGRVKAILPKYEIDSTSKAGLKPSKVQGQLTFDKVKFKYPTRPGQQILNNFSIDVPAGKTIAFVGPSGGGKSTVVKMLERFYDPVEGSVSLDGVNIKDINVKHLRSLIGYVGQEPTLFANSIADNIRNGNPEATQEQIEEAARLANAHDFISALADGYNTQVGDKGSQLSGGQKQRIAIARVLVGNPKILLLDEATSALDSESELVVQEALDKVLAAEKRTTVIIAHRLSTIRNADIIAVVQGGAIVETGTHDELMAADTGYYRSLVEKQKVMGSQESALSTSDSTGDLSNLSGGNKAVTTSSGDAMIEFKDITFAYPTRPSRQVLKDFNLQINKGETVALVGTSGGGKSTTVALIERFYDPAAGSVEFQGVDIKSLNVAWYRDQIGYVGQEPTLFNETIANNIAYGYPGASRAEIEEAARQANAYDFIMAFPDGFDTEVGEGGGQLSGGQKQRIAIARALVKKPEVLLLDEATSALDNESEAIVQAALDKLMESKHNTCIVIAHRLTTIRNADRIAFISDGGVKEFGTHDELMNNPKGRYRRLVESQERKATSQSLGMKDKGKKAQKKDDEEDEDAPDWKKETEEEEKDNFNMARARQLASPDIVYLLLGSIGALFAGSVFPMWGLLFAETIELLFRRLYDCNDELLELLQFDDCESYWDWTAEDMKDRSYIVSIYWAIAAVGCVGGNVLVFWGFGNASESMNKRVRDSSFKALCRQDVAFFDKRSVGRITSQLQDDAARIHTFTGEPIRAMLIALSSVLTGVVMSFVYMWPFAILALVCVPIMGFATSLEMKKMLGEDAGSDGESEDRNSPGGIVVETLLNISTVSALTLEDTRIQKFEEALANDEPDHFRDGCMQGVMSGLSQFIQQWINALQLWFGGWLLYNYSEHFEFNDFLISNFAILFSLFGLGAAFQDISDKSAMEESASRIFFLLDRKSPIDPLSEEGKKLK